MPDRVLDVCPGCGQPDPGGPRCPRCGASLLVDVVLTAPVMDERRRLVAARELAVLRLPGQTFPAIKRALARDEGVVLRRVARPAARGALETLRARGVACVARPAASAPVVRASRIWVLLLLAAVLIAAAGFWYSWQRRARASRVPPARTAPQPPPARGP